MVAIHVRSAKDQPLGAKREKPTWRSGPCSVCAVRVPRSLCQFATSIIAPPDQCPTRHAFASHVCRAESAASNGSSHGGSCERTVCTLLRTYDAPGIGSCGLKQAKHRPFSGHFHAQKRFFEKTVEPVGWRLAATPPACDSSFRCERAAESSEMSQHALLVFREQAIAPIESRRQGAVPRQRCPSTSREDREAIVETGRHFAKPELCYSSS